MPHVTIVTSRTADVFTLSDHVILKLFHAGLDDDAAREEHVARVVEATGIRCAAVLGRIERDGRVGIMYEKLYGPSLSHWLGLKRPWRARAAGRMLAQAHAEIHDYHAPELPSLRERMEREIRVAEVVSPRVRDLALRVVEAMPHGDTLCHGDLTIDNVMLTADRATVIDWSEAAHGDPAADVARTILHLETAYATFHSRIRQPLAQQTHALVAVAYLVRYQALRADVAARAQSWLLPVAVARLGRGSTPSDSQYLKIISRLVDNPT